MNSGAVYGSKRATPYTNGRHRGAYWRHLLGLLLYSLRAPFTDVSLHTFPSWHQVFGPVHPIMYDGQNSSVVLRRLPECPINPSVVVLCIDVIQVSQLGTYLVLETQNVRSSLLQPGPPRISRDRFLKPESKASLPEDVQRPRQPHRQPPSLVTSDEPGTRI